MRAGTRRARTLGAAFAMASLAAATVASPREACAQALAPRVVSVIGATSDVHEVVTDGARTLAATSGGLVVMRNGTVARVITAREGLPGTRLRSVSITPEGVWVGAVEGAALLRFDGASDQPTVVRTVALARVRRVVAWQGQTWLATQALGLHRLANTPGATPVRVRYRLRRAASAQTDLLDRGGELWVATAGSGVLRVGPRGQLLGRWTSANGLADDLVWDLEAHGDRVLAGTATGVAVLGPQGPVNDAPESRALDGAPVRDVRVIAQRGSETWFATYGAGVWRTQGSGRAARVEAASGARDRVRALALAAREAFVGNADGLVRVEPSGRASPLLTGGLPSADVTALAEGFGAVWIGTFDRGLAQLRDGVVTPLSTATGRWGVDRRINDLAVTRDGATGRETLWVATDRGLYAYDGTRFQTAGDANGPGREHTAALHVDARTGALWVASSRALCRLHAGAWRCFRGDEHVPVLQLSSVVVDGEGRAWAGSLHGLLRLDPESGRFERFTVSRGALPVDWVTAVALWDGGVAAGTYHGGVSYERAGRFVIEREGRAGLPSGWVNPHAMAQVGGALWVGTLERGLLVGRRGAWAHVGIAQGLPGADVTAVIAAGEGSAWVATRAGIARVEYGGARASR